ncbi:S-layer homology domain-containing protein [Paenibacillus sp. MAH-36]
MSDKTNAGKEVQVTVKGKNLTDVFAYEFNLQFDSKRLLFKDGKSAISGFTVSPIIKGDLLAFAHTKVGLSPGQSGDLTFFTLNFEAIEEGDALIQIKDVKLIDSDLKMTSQKAETLATIQIGQILLTDIDQHWAEAAIRRAISLGIVKGYDDGTFRPERPVSRSEFVTMLMRALKPPASDSKDLTFADIDAIPQWAKESLSAAVKQNVINGYEDNTFRGDNQITRTEMVTAIIRVLGLNEEASENTSFADYESIPAYAKGFVAAALKAGLVQGKEDNAFAPNDPTTRAEAVTLILRMLDMK